MYPTVHCLLPTHTQAQEVLQRLHDAGIPDDDVDYVRYGIKTRGAPAPRKAAETNTDSHKTKLSGGATAGAIAGAAAGIGAITAVGFTPLLVLAPAVITLGAAIGALTGTVVAMTALGDYGVPESERLQYEKTLQRGGALVAVRSDDEKKLERARGVIEQTGVRSRVIRLTRTLS